MSRTRTTRWRCPLRKKPRHQGPLLAEHFADIEQQNETALQGMWLFLGTELMMFGGLFAAYTVYRFLYPQAYDEYSRELNGIGLLSVFFIRALRHHYSEERYMPIDIMGLYWHLVDLIWIFLYPLFYLVHRY